MGAFFDFFLFFFYLQVREMAAVTFSGLVHYGFLQLDDKLQVCPQLDLLFDVHFLPKT